MENGEWRATKYFLQIARIFAETSVQIREELKTNKFPADCADFRRNFSANLRDLRETKYKKYSPQIAQIFAEASALIGGNFGIINTINIPADSIEIRRNFCENLRNLRENKNIS